MKMMQKIGRFCGKAGLYLRRSSPTILCCFAMAGVAGTAVAAAKASPKALKMLEDAEAEQGELTVVEKIITVAPVYIPTIAVGTGTILCIFGANVLNRRQQAHFMSAYALMNNYYKSYREKLMELYGEEADIRIRNAMARERCNFHQLRLDVPDGKVIFYDEISGESIVRYEREIMDAEYHLNRNFTLRGYAFLNEFYEFLGMRHTEYGAIAGWSVSSGIMWIDFEHRLIDNDDGGLACYSIDMVFPPEVLEEWEC